jgi:hypothetical protein
LGEDEDEDEVLVTFIPLVCWNAAAVDERRARAYHGNEMGDGEQISEAQMRPNIRGSLPFVTCVYEGSAFSQKESLHASRVLSRLCDTRAHMAVQKAGVKDGQRWVVIGVLNHSPKLLAELLQLRRPDSSARRAVGEV